MTTPRRPAVGGLRWLLPAEPMLDSICLIIAAVALLVLGAWAALWGHAWGWWVQGPAALHQRLPAIAPHVGIDAFFWLVVLSAGALGVCVIRAFRRVPLSQAWMVHLDAGQWTWWSMDHAGEAAPARQGHLRVRLDLGPWLLLQAIGSEAARRSDWMLVRTDRLGPQGAEGARLRTALNWA